MAARAAARPEDRAEIPPKIVNQNRFPTVASRVPVQLNGFQLDIKGIVPQVHKFELRFWMIRTVPVKGGQPVEKRQNLAVGPKHDVSKETRRRLLWHLFQQFIAQNADKFGSDPKIHIFDCADLMFSTRDLGLQIGDKAVKVEMRVNLDRLDEPCRTYINRGEQFEATLMRTAVVNLRNAQADFARGDRTVVQFLEILTSQRMYEQGQHYCFNNRFYEATSNIQLQGVPQLMKKGMQKNVRFVGDNQQSSGPILQIDQKKSAFFPPAKVLEYLCNELNTNPGGLLQQAQHQAGFERMSQKIKGLVLVTTHLQGSQITFANAGLTPRENAKTLEFERNGQRTNVEAYYNQVYRFRLRYPELPCVIQRTPQKESFYPMEVLEIVAGQRVQIDKQTPRLVEQMIRQCQVLPADLPAQIQAQRDQAMAQNANPYFRPFGLRVVSTDLMKAPADVLFPPAILYGQNDRVEPNQQGVLDWRTVGREINPRRPFVDPAKFPEKWAVIIVQDCVSMDACRRFCQSFVDTAIKRGLADARMPPRVDNFEHTDYESVSKEFNFYRNNGCPFVLVFAPGKRNSHPGDIHHVIKLAEQRFNVLTQHISPEMMDKGISGGGGAAMVMENILMKTNLKLGGSNFHLITSNAFKTAARNQHDIVREIWLGGNRMFVGVDFSHAPPQSLFDRQKGKATGVPTVVGMAYTVGKAMLKIRGGYWMQQPRQATIRREHQQPFIERIKQAVQEFETDAHCLPEHLIVFRGGASEGEFEPVSYWEGNSFVQAFEDLYKQRKGKFNTPAVTIIVLQCQSNYRIIPENPNRQAKAPEQNVRSGTVVDKGVMNAKITEFLAVPHKALQGTAQPVRCSVVFEYRPKSGPASKIAPQLPLEELENITNTLCYAHGIFAGSTAVPAVLYSARDLAKRGRNNWRTNTGDGARDIEEFDLPPRDLEGQALEQAQQNLDQQRANYYGQMSQEYATGIPTKFWA